MPLYLYQPEDPQQGTATAELLFPYPPPERTTFMGVVLKRVEVTAPAIVGMKPAPSQGERVLAGYHAAECQMGSRFRTRFSPNTIKREWQNDRPTAYETAADATG